MKFENIELKKINITAIFNSLDHKLITAEKLREVFKLDAEEVSTSPFNEISPVIKIFEMPKRGINIIFENNRITVDESRAVEISKILIDKYFETVCENFVSDKLVAYGFNYELMTELENKIDHSWVIGSKLISALSGSTILRSGIRVAFENAKVKKSTFDLQILPTQEKTDTSLYFMFNAHYQKEKINLKGIKKLLFENYNILTSILEKI